MPDVTIGSEMCRMHRASVPGRKFFQFVEKLIIPESRIVLPLGCALLGAVVV